MKPDCHARLGARLRFVGCPRCSTYRGRDVKSRAARSLLAGDLAQLGLHLGHLRLELLELAGRFLAGLRRARPRRRCPRPCFLTASARTPGKGENIRISRPRTGSCWRAPARRASGRPLPPKAELICSRSLACSRRKLSIENSQIGGHHRLHRIAVEADELAQERRWAGGSARLPLFSCSKMICVSTGRVMSSPVLASGHDEVVAGLHHHAEVLRASTYVEVPVW